MKSRTSDKKADELVRNRAVRVSEEVRWILKQHLAAAFKEYTSLVGSPASPADGYEFAVRLDGTLPIKYRGAIYHIPCTFLLPCEYPHRPPVVYLTPTPSMVIAPSHPSVDSQGNVFLPCLVHWNFRSSNLVGVCREMVREFSKVPPLFSKAVQTATPATPASQHGLSNVSEDRRQQITPEPARYPQCTTSSGSSEDVKCELEQLMKNRLIEVLSERATERLHMQQTCAIGHFDALESQAEVLSLKGREMDSIIQGLSSEREALESSLLRLANASAEVSKWLKHNEHKSKKSEAKSKVENILQPADVWVKQALDCQSEDAAIEDTLLALDRSMQNGSIPLDSYLKHVRNQCRGQFFKRALALKIAAEQAREGSDEGPRPLTSQPHFSRSRQPGSSTPAQDTWGLLSAAAGSAGMANGRIRYPTLP